MQGLFLVEAVDLFDILGPTLTFEHHMETTISEPPSLVRQLNQTLDQFRIIFFFLIAIGAS